MALSGTLLIGQRDVGGDTHFHAINPATNAHLEPAFACATSADVDTACRLASDAFDPYRAVSFEKRAVFLERIASCLAKNADAIIARAGAETALPEGRLRGEMGRTMGQLRLFATLVRQGEWSQPRIDPALPDRTPMPRADLRQRRIGVGPVAVFGASNFPLAFSVAGGDTVCALAAGCPVVCRAHPAHPGTSELVARAIRQAIQDCALHEGVFSLLGGIGHEVGEWLVKHPAIMSVGFTGSYAGGTALAAIAAQRAVPIPVFAEMGSINPVYLCPQALSARTETLAREFVGSLTMGVGQFCTNPGIVIALEGETFEAFVHTAAQDIATRPAMTMLTPDIHAAYDAGAGKLARCPGVTVVGQGTDDGAPNRGRPILLRTTAADFMRESILRHEVFGPVSLLVSCPDITTLHALTESLEGQLTMTLHMDDGDVDFARMLLPVFERKAGRIVVNAWPTGVEVSPAMVHGGPFPATTDTRTTSVGTASIERFLRPVCYQDLPDILLPPELGRANPLGLTRLVDGRPQAAA
ncbi:aldehyde dehydrogenase (NADP(+)) [Novacetimonas hansenii]|uniref:aldehyde dehydrogenase (NADP(+)) n=1 Tax=Novacetimonas hansenii TaxID=436 RepID=UPI000789BFED|nr:aldehyde dehydrogenase (NADP(+)) [Novacetimonas hansenii]RFO99096.1 2,5-dioxovalerate dehydrogenase [Novacetimonas hansenii]WEQ59446.1 aldehyde dehydrogenase (NADP(+)) [Novacetimonas hansenii]CUW46920.1 Alpha-ketoglutaric semialdehyde dehydrogenase [Novacetimonas hansenii]